LDVTDGQGQLMDVPRATVKAGLVLGGRNRLVELIGRGGLGDVWLSDHTVIREPAVIKLLPPEPSAEVAAGLRAWLRLIGVIDDRGLVALYDYGRGRARACSP